MAACINICHFQNVHNNNVFFINGPHILLLDHFQEAFEIIIDAL